MALRNLATRMRFPAAAVLRPCDSPPAGTPPLRSRLFSSWESHRQQSLDASHVLRSCNAYSHSHLPFKEDRESAKRLYLENLATLDRVNKHQKFMRAHVGFLEKGNKWLLWSFVLLMPLPAAAVILRVTNS